MPAQKHVNIWACFVHRVHKYAVVFGYFLDVLVKFKKYLSRSADTVIMYLCHFESASGDTVDNCDMQRT